MFKIRTLCLIYSVTLWKFYDIHPRNYDYTWTDYPRHGSPKGRKGIYSWLFELHVRINFIITKIVDMKVLKGIVHGQIRDSVGRDKIFITKRIHKKYLRWSGLIWEPHKGSKISPEKREYSLLRKNLKQRISVITSSASIKIRPHCHVIWGQWGKEQKLPWDFLNMQDFQSNYTIKTIALSSILLMFSYFTVSYNLQISLCPQRRIKDTGA